MAPRGLNLPTKNTFIEFPVPVGDLLYTPVGDTAGRPSSSPAGLRRPRVMSEPARCMEAAPEDDESVISLAACSSASTNDSPFYEHEFVFNADAPEWQHAWAHEWQEWPEQPAQYVYTVPMFDTEFPQAYNDMHYGMGSMAMQQEAC